jgi:hypothetical protein
MISPHPDQQLTKDNVLSVLALRVKLGMPVFGSDEIDDWPPGLIEELVSEGWLAEIERAKTIACDGCHDDHIEEVVLIQSPPGSPLRAYIPCPDLGRVRIPVTRLRRWEINQKRFGQNVAEISSDATTLLDRSAPMERPDPKTATIGKYWMRIDGVTGFSTKTDDKKDGSVVFRLGVAGKMTLQAKLLQILCLHYRGPVRAIELVAQIYPEESKKVGLSMGKSDKLFHKFAGLVSDLRIKTFKRAGINPEVISPITKNAVFNGRVSLNLLFLHRMDEKEPDRAGYTSSTMDGWAPWTDPEYDEEMGFVQTEEL